MVSPVAHPDDETLMADLQQGHMPAFDMLYERYSGRLLHYFYRMLNGEEEKAQDFLHDLFLKIVEKPHLYSGPRFSTWIYAVAYNMCKNEYRRMSIRQKHEHQVDAMQPGHEKTAVPAIEEQMDRQTFNDALQVALGMLKEEHRQVFLLRHQAHFTIREISEITSCSEGTVKSRLFHSLKKLAQKLRAFSPNAIER